MTFPAACVLLTVFAQAPASAPGNEKDVPVARVPPRARAAADKATAGVSWISATRIKGEGGVYFSLEGLDRADVTVIVDVTPAGDVLEIDRQIPDADVPRLVTDALKAKMPRFVVDKPFAASQAGKVVAYLFEGKRQNDSEPIMVRVSKDGRMVEVD